MSAGNDAKRDATTDARPDPAGEARRDIARDHLELRRYGMPSEHYLKYVRLLRDRLGVELNSVAGCAVGQELVRDTDAYNAVMTQEIERRFGAGVLQRLSAESAGRQPDTRPAESCPATAAATAPPATRPAYDPQIVYHGTKAFDARAASYKVTPEAATALVVKSGGGDWPSAWLACIVDDWYLFTRPYKYKRIDLAGFYVNGLTGAVEWRESDLSLLGDLSLIGLFKDFPTDMPKSASEARRYR